MDFIGLIPAGGTASRLGQLPFSKEVFPILSKGGKISVVSSNLLHYFRLASITNVFFVIRKGKWDIPAYFGDGSDAGLNIGYLMMNLPYGTPFTVDQAYPFIRDKYVAFGFPDIIFKPEDAFLYLGSKLTNGNADIMLGVVSCKEYQKSDMLEFNKEDKIQNIVIKQNRPDLKYSWFVALWRPSFTQYMHAFLEEHLKEHPLGKVSLADGTEREMYMGDVFQAAISSGLNVEYHIFTEGCYWDMGTPEALASGML